MAHPYEHARSSARKFGGVPEDYLDIHSWFDETKAFCADPRHRLIRHNAFGIRDAQDRFGVVFARKSDGVLVRTTLVGEQHVMEDFGGYIPTLNEIIDCIILERWMGKNALKLSDLLEKDNHND